MSLFSSNEEKIFDLIDSLEGSEKLGKEMQDAFFKYERPRQTWQFSEKVIKSGDLRHKVDHGEAVDNTDVIKVEEVINKSVGKNNKYIFPYTNSLEAIRNMDKKLGSDDISKKEKVEYLNLKKECAKDITEFFYGKGNFIHELAKDYLERHFKKLFELLLKCDPQKYEDMLNKKLENKKLTSEKAAEHSKKISLLSNLAGEVYGYGNDYSQKIADINSEYISVQ